MQEDFNILEMDVFTKNMSWKHIQDFRKKTASTKNKNTPAFHTFLKGNINFSSKCFEYKDFVFSPFQSIISLQEKDKAQIILSQTKLCSIPISGKIQTSKEKTQVAFSFRDKNLNIEDSLSCLRGREKKRLVSGKFDISGNISGKSDKDKDLRNLLQGDINFLARNGRIYRINLIAKILSFLNTTEALFDNMPNLQKKGLAYNKIIIETSLQNNTLKIKKGILNGKTVEMGFHGKVGLKKNKLDLVFLVAPFKTLDRFIKMIPLLNVITQGNLVSIPFQVTGKISNPTIIPLSPEAVGSEIYGIMKRTLNLPLTIFQPFLPPEDKDR